MIHKIYSARKQISTSQTVTPARVQQRERRPCFPAPSPPVRTPAGLGARLTPAAASWTRAREPVRSTAAPPPSATLTSGPGRSRGGGGPQGRHTRVRPCAVAGRGPPPAAPLLVGNLHAERFFVFVLVVIDVNQDLLLPGALTRCKPQADGVGLPSPDLEASIQS